MLWHTHVAIGAAAAIASLPAQVSTKEAIIAASVSAAAALIPDIDTPHSKIGSKHPFTSRVANFILGHRGAMHSLLGCLAVFYLSNTILPISLQHLSKYIAIGYLSHLIADMLNPAGVPLMWPLSGKRYRIPLVKTGGISEKIVLFFVALFIITKIEHVFVF